MPRFLNKQMEKITMLKLSSDMIYINAAHRKGLIDKWVFLCVGGETKAFDINRKLLKGETEASEYPKHIQSFEDVIYWANYWRERKKIPA